MAKKERLIFLLMMLFGCSSNINFTNEKMDPRLYKFLLEYELLADRYGVDYDDSKLDEMRVVDRIDDGVGGDYTTLGQCKQSVLWPALGKGSVISQTIYMLPPTYFIYEHNPCAMRLIAFHELGHCLNKLDHSDVVGYGSELMNSYPPIENACENQDFLIEDFFDNIKEPRPYKRVKHEIKE